MRDEPTKKSDLERTLQALEPVSTPKAAIEQYPTPAGIAADVAYIALAKGDISGRRVLDAGCGNGVLAISAALLEASEVVALDIDPEAIEVARRNGQRAGVDVTWRVTDIRRVEGPFDTVLMNPPFGSQKRHADLPFLDRSLEIGGVVYGFHNAKAEAYIHRRIESRGARITDRIEYAFPVVRAFKFHREDVRRVPVVLLRIEAAKR